MRKITFIQKDDNTTYDPVTTFFANVNTKKTSSQSKPITNKNNVGQFQRQPAGKIATYNMNTGNDNQQKKIILPNHDDYYNKQKSNNNKINRRGDHIPPRKPQPQNMKQQQLSNDPQPSKSKQNSFGNVTNIKKSMKNTLNRTQQQSKQLYPLTCNRQVGNNKQNQSLINQDHFITGNNKQRITATKDREFSLPNTQKQKESSLAEVISLRKKIKQLQQCSQQYNNKLHEFQQKQQKYLKIQQKYLKLQKQHKLCGENKEVAKKLMEREQQIKKLIYRQQIVYNKKRQIMLQNQINNLKKINRELVTRIKNYKGTDLVQVSLQANKCDVLFREYNHNIQINEQTEQNVQNTKNIDLSKIESISYRMIQQIQKYINNKSTNKQIPWIDDKKLLIQLNTYCKDLSIQCLGNQFKIPSTNKQCINLYNQIQNYRHLLEPIISKHDLNFIITQENIEFINNKNQQISENIQIRKNLIKTWNQQPKKFKKIAEASAYYLEKCRTQTNIYQQNQNMNNIIIAHCIAQLSFMQSWITKMTTGLRQSLTNLDIRLKQLKQLADLGQSGKQSLYLYIKNNLNDLIVKIPKIQMKIKDIGSIFKNTKINSKKIIK